MSTPYMAFSALLKQALWVFWALWLAAFVVTRTYALHMAYQAEVGRRNDERWLLRQCEDSDFYANLRQHSNLCTEVGDAPCPTIRIPLGKANKFFFPCIGRRYPTTPARACSCER